MHAFNQHAYPYQIEIAGKIDPAWSSWWNGLVITQLETSPVVSMLTGEMDQARLRGVLNQLWDMNLVILAVKRLELEVD